MIDPVITRTSRQQANERAEEALFLDNRDQYQRYPYESFELASCGGLEFADDSSLTNGAPKP